MGLNNKQTRILQQIFDDPVRSDIVWDDIESLFRGAGGLITQGNGSRVRVKLNGVKAVFHRPRPEKETDKGAVKSVRKFLSEAGVSP